MGSKGERGSEEDGAGRREFLKTLFKTGAITAGGTWAAFEGLKYLSEEFVSDLSVPEWVTEREGTYQVDGEEFEYPFTVETTEVHGTEVALIGAGHTLGIYSKYRDFYWAMIDEADGLMLERPVHGDFYNSPHFFTQLGNRAENNEIPVYQADPVNMSSTITDLAVGVVGSQGMYAGVKNTVTGEDADGEDEVFNGLSRRDFVKNTALFGGGAYLFAGSLAGASARTAVDMLSGDEGISVHGMDHDLVWGNTDYRNIVIAEGIERVCEEEDLDRLVTIHGDLHGSTLKGYLEEDELADVKEETYLPYELMTEQDVEKFVHNGGDWEQVYTL